jgi:hypothetical protein
MKEPTKKGELYSRLYLERGAPRPDSERFRVRLTQYYWDYLHESYHEKIRKEIPLKLGAEVPYLQNIGYSVSAFIKQADISDVLSAVTLIYRVTYTSGFENRQYVVKSSPQSDNWKAFVRTVLQEENIAYTLDDECGVHPLVDVEFEQNIASAIAGLGATRHKGARAAFEAGKAKLRQTPPDTKGAIRDLFESVEILTKLISASGKSLDAGFVRAELERRINKLYAQDPVAQRSGAKAAQSFADWVDAAHPYRHGHEAEEPVAPPLELAVLLTSQAASFIRWLVDLDAQLAGT